MVSWYATLDALREGDLEAKDRVARLVIGALRSYGAYDQRDQWDDVVQDVLITLLKQRPREEDDRSVAAWIQRMTTRRYLDQVRKEQGRRRAGNSPSAGWRRNIPFDEKRLRDEDTLAEGVQLDLARALAELPPRKRNILECKYALGCKDIEGAERLGESLGTYKRLASEALRELRRRLTDD
jgi:RNA polymerase sigma-70 factor (ECF subfamily)